MHCVNLGLYALGIRQPLKVFEQENNQCRHVLQED